MSAGTAEVQSGKQPTDSQSGTARSLSWSDLMFWNSPTWKTISKKLQAEDSMLLPEKTKIFTPMILTPLDKVRVCIIGREPINFVMAGEPDGLAFSSELPTKSLHSISELSYFQQNLFTELATDMSFDKIRSTSLKAWAKQGVFLWNYIPTTRRHFPFAHSGWNWDALSREIIETIWIANPRCVFSVWGTTVFDIFDILPKEALVVNAPTPWTMSPRAAGGWFGSRPFSRINRVLEEVGEKPINWRV